MTKKCEIQTEKGFLSQEAVRQLLIFRVNFDIKVAAMSLLTHVSSGVNSKEAWDTKAGIVLV